RPSAGTVRVFGEDLRALRGRSLAAYRSRTLGYADQHYTRALAPELTARELVALRLGLHGAPAAEQARTADRLLERVGLLGKGDARPAELSGGEQQRVRSEERRVGKECRSRWEREVEQQEAE